MPDRYSPIGGQAVIEGVMMRSPGKVATAVRMPDGAIQVKTQEFVSISRRAPVFGLPIVRGAVVLIESLRIGVQALAFSAEAAVVETKKSPKGGGRFGTLGLGMGFTIGVSFLLGLVVSPVVVVTSVPSELYVFHISFQYLTFLSRPIRQQYHNVALPNS